KLRTRAAIDFPSLNMAVALEIEKGVTKSVSLAVGALAARPALTKGVHELAGQRADARLADELARRAHKPCKPLTNIGVDPDWRRQILPVLVRRTLMRALGCGHMITLRQLSAAFWSSNGDRDREVVQRREGVWFHYA